MVVSYSNELQVLISDHLTNNNLKTTGIDSKNYQVFDKKVFKKHHFLSLKSLYLSSNLLPSVCHDT